MGLFDTEEDYRRAYRQRLMAPMPQATNPHNQMARGIGQMVMGLFGGVPEGDKGLQRVRDTQAQVKAAMQSDDPYTNMMALSKGLFSQGHAEAGAQAMKLAEPYKPSTKGSQYMKGFTPWSGDYTDDKGNKTDVVIAPQASGRPIVYTMDGKIIEDVDPSKLNMHSGRTGESQEAGYGRRERLSAVQQNIKDMTKLSEDLRELGNTGTANLTRYKYMSDLLQRIETGTFEQAELELKKAANYLGAGFNVRESEAFQSQAIEEMLAYIQETKGAISEAENELFLKAAPGLNKTKEGNQLIIDFAIYKAQAQKDLDREFNIWYKRTPATQRTANNWALHKDVWREERPAFELDKRLTSLPAETAPEEKPVATPTFSLDDAMTGDL